MDQLYRVKWGTHSRPDAAGVLRTYKKGDELALTPEQALKLGAQVEVVGDFVPRQAETKVPPTKPVVELPAMTRGRGARAKVTDPAQKAALDPAGVRDVIPGVQEGDVLVIDPADRKED